MMAILNYETWLWFAYSAIGLIIMAGTLVIHMQVTPMKAKEPYLLVIGAIFGALGCIVGGMQTGTNPMIPREDALPIVRLLWAIGITFGNVAAILYIVDRHKRQGKEQ